MKKKQIAFTHAEMWQVLNIFKTYRKEMEALLSDVQKNCREQECFSCDHDSEIKREIALEEQLGLKFLEKIRQFETNKRR